MPAGKKLDHEKALENMQMYFERLKSVADSKKLSSRIRFMILDLIDLRRKGWIPRRGKNQQAATTVEQVARPQQQEIAGNQVQGPCTRI